MKNRLTAGLLPAALLLLLPAITPAQEFGSVRYLGHFTPSGGSYVAGCWGWTDTLSGREYALLGNYSGTAIVEVTNPAAMVERDFIPGPSSGWREISVHRNYAYVVTEGGGGTQIIDLSFLPDSAHLVKSYTYSASGKNSGAAHTIHIADGYMYLNGCSGWPPGGILVFSLADPVNPLYRGEYAGNYIHDCSVRNDTIYGAGIYTVGINIINATVKTAPALLRTISYPSAGTHNTATTVDGGYVLSTDEINGTPKTLKIWSLANDSMVAEYVGSPTAIVHNVFVRESLAIMSYYTAGIRVVDISDPTSPVEVGGYDTYPAGDPGVYNGAWSVYPYFPSGRIVIGDMASGMYVVEVNADAPLPPAPFSAYSDYATPNGVTLTWTDPTQKADGSPLSNFKLHLYRGTTYVAEVDSGIQTWADAGLSTHTEYTYFIRAVTASDSSNVNSTSAWAGGHPDPKPPTGFTVYENLSGNVVRWTNPSRQLDDTPLNDLAWVVIHRDGVPFDSVAQSSADTGQVREWTDTAKGFRTYSVRARDNESPVHYSTPTATGSGFGGLYTSFAEGFDGPMIKYQVTAGWDTTSSIAAGGIRSFTDSPAGYYPPNSNRSVTFPRVILGADPILRFRHIALVAFGDIAFLEISRTNRQTWSTLKVYNMVGHASWVDSTADPGDWELQLFDLNAWAGDTVNVRFRLSTNPSVNADGWYIDELYLGSSNEPASVETEPAAGWNLVSLPVIAGEPLADSLYPDALTPAYGYDGVYAAAETLANGRGYWVKFGPGASADYDGLALFRDTVDLAAGWNLVGSVSVPIAASTIASIPPGSVTSDYYGYDGGYAAASTLQPGQGYWVKSSQTSKIILSGFLQSIPAAAARGAGAGGGEAEGSVAPAATADAGTLTFIDADGRKGSLLLFAGGPAAASALPSYDLPPAPPEGAFDVRFAGGRRAAFFTGSGESAIELGTTRWPVELSWRLPDGATASLATGEGSRELAGAGSMTLEAPPARLALSYRSGEAATATEIPTEFSLSQNYPNPFNPSTTLEFRLPEAGVASIALYNPLGQRVASLGGKTYPAGVHRIAWDASSGADLPGGVYLAVLTVAGADGGTLFTASRKMILLR